MDPTTSFVLALLALLVSAASFLVSLLTHRDSRRRDFPRSKLELKCTRTDSKIHVHVESVGAGVATRIQSSVWHSGRKEWQDQGPWYVSMAPGDKLGTGTFDISEPAKGIRVRWYDETRQDRQRTAILRWKS